MDQAAAYSTGEVLGLVWTILVGLGVAALAAKIFNGLFQWTQGAVEFGSVEQPKLSLVRLGVAVVLTKNINPRLVELNTGCQQICRLDVVSKIFYPAGARTLPHYFTAGCFCFFRVPVGCSNWPRSSHWTLALGLAGTRILHAHSRHTAAGATLASALRLGIVFSGIPLTPAEFYLAHPH